MDEDGKITWLEWPLNKGPLAEVPDGIYRDMPFETYMRLPFISRSALNVLHESTPLHLLNYRTRGIASTPALIAGAAAHTAILERPKFDELYARGPEGDKRTKAVQEAWAEAESVHGEGYVLRPEGNRSELGYDDILAMSDACLSDPTAGPLIRDALARETTVIFTDADTGVRVKCRLDLVGRSIIYDYKTTAGAITSDHSLKNAVATYGYHRQGGLYIHAMIARMDDRVAGQRAPRRFGIIFQEKRPPYAVRVVELAQEDLLAGRAQMLTALHEYAACEAADLWPGHSGIPHLSLPPYATTVYPPRWKLRGKRLARTRAATGRHDEYTNPPLDDEND